VADLARIELTPEEEVRFQRELERVLTYVHQLNELDLSGLEPASHPQPRLNVLREDGVTEAPPAEDLMRNAPARVQGLFRVPPMMEES
jgi:aspartyl-tRNA(Asn)/glutamyl-tRNA(Gln) amidotransferase subunit C